jgi:hypothetical protein
MISIVGAYSSIIGALTTASLPLASPTFLQLWHCLAEGLFSVDFTHNVLRQAPSMVHCSSLLYAVRRDSDRFVVI